MWLVDSSTRLHETHVIDVTVTPLSFYSTDDGILPIFARHMKHRILNSTSLHHSNGSSLTTWPANSIRSCNEFTEKRLLITKPKAQRHFIESQCIISLESILRFFGEGWILTIFLQTRVLDLLEKLGQCLPSKPWIHRMTFAYMTEWSDFKRHIHLANKEMLRPLMEPSPIPPTPFGAISVSHAT